MHGGDAILDTNAAIAMIADDRALFLQLLAFSGLSISVFTLAELEYGVVRSRRKEEARAGIERIRMRLPVVCPGEDCALFYATILGALERRGARIPVMDVWIAAVAMSSGCVLVTRDQHFSHVPGLRVQAW